MSFSRYGTSQEDRFLMQSQRGFTLVELMTTISVLAVLVGIAVPALQEMTLGSRLRSQANDLAAGVILARSEAIKRNRQVELCASSDASTCTGAWGDGWIVKVAVAGGAVIKKHAAAPDGFRINSVVNTVVFNASGVGATPSTLTVCRATPSLGGQERVLTISATGRTTVSSPEPEDVSDCT